MNEQAVTITLAGQQMMGIIHQADYEHAEYNSDTAVVIVVGGPQYRVGSHRQFVQLARHLANKGITTMRFDYRGMGDSEAEKQPFDYVCDDIRAAIDILQLHRPEIKNIIIWGLCDAASAALIYAHKDPRVSGLVLLNPWLQSEQAMGKTMIKHYYIQRLLSKTFWTKLLRGNINFSESVGDAKGFVTSSLTTEQNIKSSYQSRMVNGLNKFNGNLCLILSGNDLTAREFVQQAKGGRQWRALWRERNEIHKLAEADHTFSTKKFKCEVENITHKFVQAQGG